MSLTIWTVGHSTRSLDELLALLAHYRIEVLWWRCHRRLIADVLTSLGVEVVHIRDQTSSEIHRLATPARVVDGVLTYAYSLS